MVYYTTFTLLFSLFTTVVLRTWDPYTGRKVIYTKTLWLKGRDTFLKFQPGEDGAEGKLAYREFDLYEWFNLAPAERNKMLLLYCRTLNDDQVDEIFEPKKNQGVQEADNSTSKDGCCTTDTFCNALGWFTSACHPKEDSEQTKKEKEEKEINVVALTGFTVEDKGYAPHDKDADGKKNTDFDSTSRFIYIPELTDGKVVGKSTVSGEVLFKFEPKLKSPERKPAEYRSHDKSSMIMEMGKEDAITVSVPMENLLERNPEWAYTRSAFGVGPLNMKATE